jgi:hypothetical protein
MDEWHEWHPMGLYEQHKTTTMKQGAVLKDRIKDGKSHLMRTGPRCKDEGRNAVLRIIINLNVNT